MTMTKASAPTKADLKAADELDAMADSLGPATPWEDAQKLDDIEFGKDCATSGIIRKLRIRAAELRQDPKARFM